MLGYQSNRRTGPKKNLSRLLARTHDLGDVDRRWDFLWGTVLKTFQMQEGKGSPKGKGGGQGETSFGKG